MRLRGDDPRLTAYHDAMLTPRQMRLIRDLLEQEEEARSEYEDLRRTVHILRKLADPQPPPEFWPTALRNVRRQAMQDRRRRRFRRLVRSTVAASAVILTICGVVLMAVALWPYRGAIGDLDRLREIYATHAAGVTGVDGERLRLLATEAQQSHSQP